MKKIAIIGAGQAGLQLGLSLLKDKYQVSIYSEHTPESIFNTPAPGTSVMFDDTLGIERKLGLDFWQNTAPQIKNFNFSICLPNGKRLLHRKGDSLKPFQAIDQRLKFSVWMNAFKECGGNLIHQKLKEEDLELIAEKNDAVFVATGKDLIGNLFEIDSSRTIYEKSQRNLAIMIVKNFKETENFQMDSMNVNIFPVGGEIFIVPYLDKNNEKSVSLLIEAQEGEAFDFFKEIKSGEELISVVKLNLKKSMPWISDAFDSIQLIDPKSYAIGAIRPLVRKPFAKLPSGKLIFPIGDALTINDPVAAQGSNSASRMAYTYYQAILKNHTNIFDEKWATNAFEHYWQEAGQYAQTVSKDFLKPAGFQLDALVGYTKNTNMLLQLMEGINIPRNLYQWFGHTKTIQQKLKEFLVPKSTIILGKLYLLRNIIAYVLGKKLGLMK